MVTFANGVTEDRSSGAQWSSETPNVAVVSSNGKVTAVEDGRTLITAKFQTLTAFGTFIVDLPTAAAAH